MFKIQVRSTEREYFSILARDFMHGLCDGPSHLIVY